MSQDPAPPDCIETKAHKEPTQDRPDTKPEPGPDQPVSQQAHPDTEEPGHTNDMRQVRAPPDSSEFKAHKELTQDRPDIQPEPGPDQPVSQQVHSDIEEPGTPQLGHAEPDIEEPETQRQGHTLLDEYGIRESKLTKAPKPGELDSQAEQPDTKTPETPHQVHVEPDIRKPETQPGAQPSGQQKAGSATTGKQSRRQGNGNPPLGEQEPGYQGDGDASPGAQPAGQFRAGDIQARPQDPAIKRPAPSQGTFAEPSAEEEEAGISDTAPPPQPHPAPPPPPLPPPPPQHFTTGQATEHQRQPITRRCTTTGVSSTRTLGHKGGTR